MQNPPIYIINLARTPERRFYIQRQLDALNLKYSFVEAIDKHDLVSRENRTKIAKQVDIKASCLESIYQRCRDIGPVACLLSHLKVYNLMIKNNIDVACVLEDDAYLLPTFTNILAESDKVPWDIFMLSSHSAVVGNVSAEFLADKNKILRPFIAYYKLLHYKKYWPQLDPNTRFRIALKAPKHVLLKYVRTIQSYFNNGRDKEGIASRGITSFALEIGALPTHNKSSWHKITSAHYAARPHISSRDQIPISIISCMGYLLKLAAAKKWKKAVIRLAQQPERMDRYAIPGYASRNLEIDHIPRYLYCRGDAELYILIPPCIRAESKYMVYSARFL